MTLADVIVAIDSVQCDEKLELLFETLRQRQRQVYASQGRRILAELSVGTKVKFGNLRPKYLIGMQGTVAGFKGANVKVTLPHSVGKFGTTVVCPASLLEIIEE